MKHIALEKELRSLDRKRRVTEAILTGIFWVITIVFLVLYEQSRTVEEISFGPITHQSVTYNTNFTWGILVGALGLTVSAIFLICDFLFSKLITVEVNGDYITFYRGLTRVNLYVNGEIKDSLSVGYYLEAPLSDRTKVNVALGKWSAHLTFTNGHPPIDV